GRDRGPALSSPRAEGSHAADRRGVPVGLRSRSVSELRTGQAALLRSRDSGGSDRLVRQAPEGPQGVTRQRAEFALGLTRGPTGRRRGPPTIEIAFSTEQADLRARQYQSRRAPPGPGSGARETEE